MCAGYGFGKCGQWTKTSGTMAPDVLFPGHIGDTHRKLQKQKTDNSDRTQKKIKTIFMRHSVLW